MYTSDPALIEPPDDAILWRYQRIDKFRSFVKESALHFAYLQKLDDPREGTLTSAMVRAVKDFWVVSNKERKLEDVNAIQRRLVAVNCWHWDDYENSLMWSSYAHPGVAIKTRFDLLKECFRLTPHPIYGGSVQYIDHDIDDTVRVEPLGQGLTWSTFELACLKYPSFKGEKEVRLIAYLANKSYDGITGELIPYRATEFGVFVEVSLYRLLSEVVLSPDAGSELEEEVRELVKPINDALPLNKQIRVNRSTLYG